MIPPRSPSVCRRWLSSSAPEADPPAALHRAAVHNDAGVVMMTELCGASNAKAAEMADSLSLAMLVLLESLSPEQRAVLLLHDVFDYGYPEIAAIVGKSEDNVRQLATRARRHVKERRPRFQTTHEQRNSSHVGSRGRRLDAQQRLIGVWALDIAGGQITSIGAIVNPTGWRTSGQSPTSDGY